MVQLAVQPLPVALGRVGLGLARSAPASASSSSSTGSAAAAVGAVRDGVLRDGTEAVLERREKKCLLTLTFCVSCYLCFQYLKRKVSYWFSSLPHVGFAAKNSRLKTATKWKKKLCPDGREGGICLSLLPEEGRKLPPPRYILRTYIRFTTDGQLVLLFDDSRGDCPGRPPTVEKQWQKKGGINQRFEAGNRSHILPRFNLCDRPPCREEFCLFWVTMANSIQSESFSAN